MSERQGPTGWRFVEQERLKVGDQLPEGCALVPPESLCVGEIYYAGGLGLVRVVDGALDPWAKCIWAQGEPREYAIRHLFHVVEPIPATPQKLGRLPKIGEKFWVEVECLQVGKGEAKFAAWTRLGWFSEADLGIDLSGKRAELAAARARVAELERELGGGE